MPRRQAQIAKPSGGLKTSPNRASPAAVKQDPPVPFTSVAGNQATNAVITSTAPRAGGNAADKGLPRTGGTGAKTSASSLGHSPTRENAPAKTRGQDTAQAVAKSAARASSLRASGGAATGATRGPKDQTKRQQAGPATKSTASPAVNEIPDSLPKEDATRALQPGPEYWLSHSPDIANMDPFRLRDEANQIDEWVNRQIANTPAVERLKEVGDRFHSELAKDKKLEDAGLKNRPRRSAKRAESASKGPVPHSDPQALEQKYNDTMTKLRRQDLAPADRKRAQTELSELRPELEEYLGFRSAVRHGQAISRALTPSSGDAPTQLVETVRRVDSISPLSDHPGLNYLVHGTEMIVIPDAAADAIRANTLKSLDLVASQIPNANDEVQADYVDLSDRSFRTHPVVGFISSLYSGENPGDWEEKLRPIVQQSNIAWQQFNKLRQASKDPWSTDRPDLLAMANKVAAAQRLSDNARNYLDCKTDKLLEGTATAVRSLEGLRTLGQITASAALTPLGGALYGAGESVLEQTSEIHYGQRQSYDYAGIAINTGAGLAGSAVGGYVGGKLGKGVLSLAGESAPTWLRGVASVTGAVGGGRAGAATTTVIGGVANLVFGRSDASASDFFGAAGHELVDLKGGALDLVGGGLGHAVRSNARPSTSWFGRKLLVQPPANRVPAAAPPPSAAGLGKTSAPTGAADVGPARVHPPPTTETQTPSAADTARAPSAAGNIHPPTQSTPTALVPGIGETLRAKLQAGPETRGISGSALKPAPAPAKGTQPKGDALVPAEMPDPATSASAKTKATESKVSGQEGAASESGNLAQQGRDGPLGSVSERLARRGVTPELDVDVEKSFVEEQEDQPRPKNATPAKRPRTKAAKDARKEFNKERDKHAIALSVPKGGQVHHGIEIQALNRAPGAFSKNEINDPNSMRGIPSEEGNKRQLHNSKIREVEDRHYAKMDELIKEKGLKPGTKEFNEFVRQYQSDLRAEIDHLYGNFFSETRRRIWKASN